MPVPESVKAARTAFENAAKELREAVQGSYPLGTLVIAKLGRAEVTGEVTGYSHDWHFASAGEMTIRNIDTGKLRRVSAATELNEIVIVTTRPKGAR